MVQETTELCSEPGDKVLKFKFQCLPDDSEYPIGTMVLLGIFVTMCAAFCSFLRWKWLRFKAPLCPPETAVFKNEDSRMLIKSHAVLAGLRERAPNLWVHSPMNSLSISSWAFNNPNSPRSPHASNDPEPMPDTTCVATVVSANTGLPNLFHQRDNFTKIKFSNADIAEAPKDGATKAHGARWSPASPVTLFGVVPYESDAD